jgi:6-pyruvoyltetrahydropterin/6-carboxytetrahydropterin synthase
VIVGGEIDPTTGMVCDLVELDGTVRREVLDPFDHQNLNTLPAFQNRVPTTENLVLEIHARLEKALPQARTLRIRVEETSNNFFEYYEEPLP